jgi:hypothetical protein
VNNPSGRPVPRHTTAAPASSAPACAPGARATASSAGGPVDRHLLLLVLVLGVLGTVALGVTAPPASAEPARAGQDRSVVLGIEPATSAEVVAVSVAGGDTALVLDVRPGHDVMVLGYEREPFLHVQPDGTVQLDTASRSAAVDTDRAGLTPTPTARGTTAAATSAGGPEAAVWVTTGTGGHAVWHDHRVHWMAPSLDPAPDADGRIQDWTVELVVDGRSTVVRGELRREPDQQPWPFAVLAVLSALGLLAIGHRRPRRGLVITLAVASTAATITATVALLSRPPGATADIVALGLAAGMVATTVLAAAQGRRRPRLAWYAALAGTAAAAAYLTQFLPEWWRAVLVTAMPAGGERALVALIAGATLAAALQLLQAVEDSLAPPRPRGRRPLAKDEPGVWATVGDGPSTATPSTRSSVAVTLVGPADR